MKIAELLWPFQSQDMGLVHRKIINSLSFYQCVRMLTSRTLYTLVKTLLKKGILETK